MIKYKYTPPMTVIESYLKHKVPNLSYINGYGFHIKSGVLARSKGSQCVYLLTTYPSIDKKHTLYIFEEHKQKGDINNIKLTSCDRDINLNGIDVLINERKRSSRKALRAYGTLK